MQNTILRRLPSFGLPKRLIGGALAAGFVLPGLTAGLGILDSYFPIGVTPDLIDADHAAWTGLGVCIAGVLAGPVYALRRRKAGPAILSGLFVLGVVAGLVPAAFGAVHLQAWGYELFSARSTTLIEAIHTYQRSTGQAPAKLQELVPNYIPAIPGTGMPVLAKYRYGRLSGGICSPDNSWHLTVISDRLGRKECLVYCPMQDYDNALPIIRKIHGQWGEVQTRTGLISWMACLL